MLHKLTFKYQRKHGMLPVQLNPLDSALSSMDHNSKNNGDGNDIYKNLALTNMPSMKEEALFGALNLRGEIAHINSVDNIIPLCKKATDAFACLMLSVLLRTNDSKILKTFLESGGASILKKWLKQFNTNKNDELMSLILEVLSTIPITEKAIKESKIGKTISNIAKNEDGFKSEEADHILNKWRQDVVNQRKFEEEEQERMKIEAEKKAKLKKKQEEKERIWAEERKKKDEEAKKIRDEIRQKRAAEKAEAKATKIVAAEKLKHINNKDNVDISKNFNTKNKHNKKRGRDNDTTNTRRKSKKPRIRWQTNDKLNQYKLFRSTDIVQNPNDNNNAGSSSGKKGTSSGKKGTSSIKISSTSKKNRKDGSNSSTANNGQVNFKEALQMEKEKEAMEKAQSGSKR